MFSRGPKGALGRKRLNGMGYQVLYGIIATSREVFGSIHYKITVNQIQLNICSFMEDQNYNSYFRFENWTDFRQI